MSKYDAVHHPSHYTEGRKYEPKDVIRDWGLNFNIGSAVKYLARAGRKDDIVQDLKKAIEFIQFEIDALTQSKPYKITEETTEDGVTCGVIELSIPEGMSPEDILKAILDELHGGN